MNARGPAPMSMRDERPFLPFARPDISDAEIAAVVECLRSEWLTTGPITRDFEREFAARVRPAGRAIAVNSATAGLHLALESIGVVPGDRVVVPVYTFTATAEVVRYLGADPDFVDVDADTLNVTSDQLADAITDRTKVVIPVHIGGLACAMDDILPMARARGVAVVDDAAHALPTARNGTAVGAFDTDATVFSFYATKTLTTGEGGMIVTSRADVAERCALMRLHGMHRRAPQMTGADGPAWRYEILEPGFKYNLTDIAAALGRVQLRRLQTMTDRRTAIAARYRDAFADLPVRVPHSASAGDVHAWHLFILRLEDGCATDRDRFIDRMHMLGVGCSVHFIALHLQPYWRDRYNLKAEMFPNADAASRCAVSLPIYSVMSDDDVDRVIDAVRQVVTRG